MPEPSDDVNGGPLLGSPVADMQETARAALTPAFQLQNP